MKRLRKRTVETQQTFGNYHFGEQLGFYRDLHLNTGLQSIDYPTYIANEKCELLGNQLIIFKNKTKKKKKNPMNVSNGMDMIAEGFLWSTVIMSHRSTGMLSQSWFTLSDRQER